MAADDDVKPLSAPGQNGNGRSSVDNIKPTSGGTSTEYLVRRLKRDHPKIAKALARGEYASARAAGIAAGIVRVPTPSELMQRAWKKASKDERKSFSEWIFTEEAGHA
jgi:hypothetical protein